jgi:hypothetical protein
VIHDKAVSQRIDSLSYENLREEVPPSRQLEMSSLRSMSNLEVPHKEFRSHLGEDSVENLITLCTECHGRIHGR